MEKKANVRADVPDVLADTERRHLAAVTSGVP
jgi:hypothetical protein